MNIPDLDGDDDGQLVVHYNCRIGHNANQQ